ncbi:alkaline ceramidase family protein [Pochonia chlamydosporia 170]|uniref:Alkaline ceramidase family protein n=1 Tax=Pochonia chlamydosporia 170 TaxID=1380566 RepID=A0A179FKL1_METCM|nr:alkaline ceramidase family protein [Pochonia chlamydosporia 170]OAQ66094.1 alkaline ceramidase family protein [Pochonia chlamydosporia 170]
MRFSIPYRETPHEPILGAPTARANFCEEDYIISGLVAEFINTITNIIYVIYALRHLSRRPTKDGTLAAKAPFYGLALVGICSALFHGTLKFHAQMGDDLSMLVASSCVLYRAMTFDRTWPEIKTFTVVLVVSLATVIVYHVATDEQVVHELAFVLLIFLVGLRTRSLIKTRVKSESQQATLRRNTLFGAACFAIGYFLWQLDLRYCSQLTRYKRQVGMPWSFLLEFHGYWHVLTAIGACTFMVMVEDLTNEDKAKDRKKN